MSIYCNRNRNVYNVFLEEKQEDYEDDVESQKRIAEDKKQQHAAFLEEEKKRVIQNRLNAWYTINLYVRGINMDTENPLEKVREGLRVYGDVMDHSLSIKWQSTNAFIVYGFKIRRFENDDRGSLSEMIRDRFFSERPIHCFYTVTDGTQHVRKAAFVTACKEAVSSEYVYELMEALKAAEDKYDKLQAYRNYLCHADESTILDTSHDTSVSTLPPRPPKVTRDVCYVER